MDAVFRVPELGILIFQNCNSLNDALSLAYTCRSFASIWRKHSTAIVAPLAEAEIIAFPQALVAASLATATQESTANPHLSG